MQLRGSSGDSSGGSMLLWVSDMCLLAVTARWLVAGGPNTSRVYRHS